MIILETLTTCHLRVFGCMYPGLLVCLALLGRAAPTPVHFVHVFDPCLWLHQSYFPSWLFLATVAQCFTVAAPCVVCDHTSDYRYMRAFFCAAGVPVIISGGQDGNVIVSNAGTRDPLAVYGVARGPRK